jgi:putative Holliday junction resolvase
MALQALVHGDFKKKDRRKKENIDQISATLILQEYLQSIQR